MEDRELALARLVPQVEVEVGEPRARHQPLVDDGLAGAGRDVHTHALALGGPFSATARAIEPVFPLDRVESGILDQAMPDRGHRLSGPLSERVRVDRHLAPPDQAHAMLSNGLFDHVARALVPVEERHDAVGAADDAPRHLDQQAGPVSTLAVRVETATVCQAGEGKDAECDRLMTAVRRGDEAHAAGSAGCREVPRPR